MHIRSCVIALASLSALAAAQAPSIDDYTSAEISDGTAFADVNKIALSNMKSNIDSRSSSSTTSKRSWLSGASRFSLSLPGLSKLGFSISPHRASKPRGSTSEASVSSSSASKAATSTSSKHSTSTSKHSTSTSKHSTSTSTSSKHSTLKISTSSKHSTSSSTSSKHSTLSTASSKHSTSSSTSSKQSMSTSSASCTFENAEVRTEFREMSNEDRKAYTDAVLCLQSTAPQRMTASEASSYPGVKSRYDEYVATHINMTYNIHGTADFLAWHRFFIWQYEQDLRNLCGYTGNQPYWNWALDSDAPQDSPLFKGDEYSMGSNGAYVPDRSDTYLYTQQVDMPPGTGGGCVTSGPFSNYTVNLGPLDLPDAGNVDSDYQWNPRCLQRDLNPFFTEGYNTWTNVTDLVLDSIYLENFQWSMQGYASGDAFGVHGAGHWAVGGSMSDFHSSPSDPIFFLHHGMIDRIWTIWQNLDISRRQDIIQGTSTINNSPESAPMALTDSIPFGFVAEDRIFSTLMDTFAYEYCYRYD